MLGAVCSRAIYYGHRQVGDKISFTRWVGVSSLDLCDNGLSDESCAHVVANLDAAHICKLDLSSNGASSKLCTALADTLPPQCVAMTARARALRLLASPCLVSPF